MSGIMDPRPLLEAKLREGLAELEERFARDRRPLRGLRHWRARRELHRRLYSGLPKGARF
jgi:hypothetical protein